MPNLSKEKLLIIIALALSGVSLTASVILGLQVIKLKQDLIGRPFPTPIPTITPTPEAGLSPTLIPEEKSFTCPSTPPIACPQSCVESELVCGDDGRTYCNACQACQKGVEWYTPGKCREATEPQVSCQTDADCPGIACAQGCPADGPCPPCPQNKCIDGRCQTIYPNYSESLNKKIQLFVGQTASIEGTSLSLTLLRVTLSQENCYSCPVDTEVRVKSGFRTENIIFHTPGIATKEWGPHRVKEVFGFQIRLESVQPELIILRVQKL